MTERRDRWAEWLAETRFGGDPAMRARLLVELAERRDKVLDLAQLSAGETLLDVGCGEGLIGFGARSRRRVRGMGAAKARELREQQRASSRVLRSVARGAGLQAVLDEVVGAAARLCAAENGLRGFKTVFMLRLGIRG